MCIIESFYDQNSVMEWNRLDAHPLEFEITKKVLDTYIERGSRIADIGGGPGKYSFYLQNEVNSVSLVDISSENIELAKRKSKELQINLDEYIHGNATDLSFLETGSFDVVLCMGPMYHFFNDEDKDKAVSETLRILKKDGIVVFAFLSKFALPFMVFESFPERIDEYQNYFDDVFKTGMMKGPLNNGFDACMFFPDEIIEYLSTFDIELLELSGAEGLFAQSENRFKTLSPEVQKEWIEFSFKHRSQPSIVGANNHLLYVGRKK